MPTKTVIITAGGIGNRMKSELPKQFLLLCGEVILARTVRQFYTYDPSIELILTLPEHWKSYWLNWCEENQFEIKHQVIDGGKERYHSVQNALNYATGELIAIHDAGRPLLSLDLIKRGFESVLTLGAVIPVVPVKESVRFSDGGHTKALDRRKHFLVQTPQIFQREIIQQAYCLPYHEGITDDASLVEENGNKIYLFDGEEQNIKITSPFDLKIAENWLEDQTHLGNSI